MTETLWVRAGYLSYAFRIRSAFLAQILQQLDGVVLESCKVRGVSQDLLVHPPQKTASTPELPGARRGSLQWRSTAARSLSCSATHLPDIHCGIARESILGESLETRKFHGRSISHVKPNRQLPILQPGNPAGGSGGNLLHCRPPLSPAPLSALINWELNACRRRPAFSYHLKLSIEKQQRRAQLTLKENNRGRWRKGSYPKTGVQFRFGSPFLFPEYAAFGATAPIASHEHPPRSCQ
jgi:hypothetical protein